MGDAEKALAEKFVCAKCRQKGAHVEKLAMTGTGWSRLFDIQRHRYAFVSCLNCGYTEAFNLRVLTGKGDTLGTFLDILFGG